MRRQLLEALRARLSAFHGGDPAPVLAEESLLEADALWESVRFDNDESLVVEAVYVLACLNWVRYLVLPEGQGDPDLYSAVHMFGLLAAVHPELVPSELWPLLDTTNGSDEASNPELWATQGTELLRQGLALSDLELLDRAIELLQRAESATTPKHPDHARWLTNLGIALRARFGRTGQQSNLDDAVEVYRRAVAATDKDDRERGGRLASFGAALQIRFGRTGHLADLDEAVELGRQAVAATRPGDPLGATDLFNLALGLQTRFGRTGQLADLDEAVELGRQAVAAALPEDPDRATFLSSLGLGLQTRFERTGRLADLDEALDVCRQAAADTTPPDPPNRARRLSNLCGLLVDRFMRAGRLADLDEAVEVGRLAVAETPPGHRNRVGCLANLGSALAERFMRAGQLADLDEAIEVGRQAVAAGAPDHPDRGACLSNLGNMLRIRAERTGRLADLDEAVEVGRQAMAGRPDRTGYAKYLFSLAHTLADRFEWTGQLADLDEAVEVSWQAVADTPSDHPNRAAYLSNLGPTLANRFMQTGQVADLDEAVEVSWQAVADAPSDHPNRAGYLFNLGNVLRIQFEQTGRLADLDEAVEVSWRAVADAPSDHPNRALFLSNLGQVLRIRFDRTGQHADLDEAAECYRSAAMMTTASTRQRITAALGWARAAERLGSGATVQGYRMAVGLLPQLAARGLDRVDREHLLDEWTGLAGEAAAAAIVAGQPEVALELLEQGRAVLWSQLLDARTDLTKLREYHPGLAEQLGAVLAVLDPPTDDGLSPSEDASPQNTRRQSKRRAEAAEAAARRFDELVAEIRSQPGFESFLHPPTAPDLLHAAIEGPVVVVNVAMQRCDALLVSTSGVEVAELPDLSLQEAVDRANGYLAALHALDRANNDLDETHQGISEGALDPAAIYRYTEAKRAWQRALADTNANLDALLRWLWDTTADPVLTALGFIDVPEPQQASPRIWWCPTGLLALLPLHAAGYHNEQDTTGRTVLDRVVSSYTPTLRAMIQARRPPESGATDERMLVVCVPDAPDTASLVDVARERVLLTTRFADHHSLLEGEDATQTAVCEMLPRHRWAHFSCHGGQDLADPSRGGLLLHDGMLTVTDISSQQYDGEFAFLSACMTATGGVNLPDEVITLAAALHYTGYRQVIGTLWSVYDRTAADLAEEVYNELSSNPPFDPSRAADVMHTAIRRLRDTRRVPVNAWTPFIHTGI